MRIVITGASGNLGTGLLRQLAQSGGPAHELVGVCRRLPPQRAPYDQAEWFALDISQPHAQLELARAFEGADAVVHLAWLIQPSYDREQLRRTNQDGSARVQAAVREAGVPHLVHASSVGVYSPRTDLDPVTEDWPREGVPSSHYSLDKAAVEHQLDELEQHGDVVVSRVRPSLIMQGSAASEISRYFLPHWLPPVLVRPGALRLVPYPEQFHLQFVHANDVGRAIVAVLEHRAPGAFNVAAGPAIDRGQWRRLFGRVAPSLPLPVVRALAAASWRAHLQPVDPGWVDLAAAAPLLDTTRIRELGWRPAHRADEALTEFVGGLIRKSGTPSPALAPR